MARTNKTAKSIDKVAMAISRPSGYATVKLGMDLHKTQKDIIDTLFREKKVIFRAANGTGKTSIVLVASILYALDILNAQVVSTSATYRQVTAQLIPCLRRYSHLYPSWEFLDNAISINNVKRYIGFSADSEATFQGFHEYPGQPLLIIVDEAAGVGDPIFRAIDRCRPTYYLITGSPLSPEGEFYNLETNPTLYKYFIHFKMTQPDCPWIKRDDIDQMVAKWGNEHPLVRSSVYAEFSNEAENAILSLSSLNRCITDPPPFMPGSRQVAIDFAAGGAENVIAYCCGNQVQLIKCWREKDTMSAAGAMVKELDILKASVGLRPNEVWGDASGLGLPICHRLAEMGWPIRLFYGQAKPTDENYKNKIAECWLDFAKRVVNRTIILPNDTDLKAQLLGRKQRLNSSGKLELESKEDMAGRGMPSPDRADAIAMAVSNMSGGDVTFMRALGVGDVNQIMGCYS
jgi:hypothetical protein